RSSISLSVRPYRWKKNSIASVFILLISRSRDSEGSNASTRQFSLPAYLPDGQRRRRRTDCSISRWKNQPSASTSSNPPGRETLGRNRAGIDKRSPNEIQHFQSEAGSW